MSTVPTSGGVPEQPPANLTADDRQWAMFAHLSGLITGLVGLNFVGPLVIWIMKKEQSPFIDYHAKEALNFQLNIMAYILISVPLLFCFVGIATLAAAIIYGVVMAIVAGIRANEGQYYKYPFLVRLIQ
ncbi:MAG: DUF4870 domain-containing protein [Gemmataceae bacterium]|nr:DUF4870 domain-containing protein [Gemmataceae bacterium]MDW8264677.1 DUF4870 domain-containing protein [Gemmataceae bacterium]